MNNDKLQILKGEIKRLLPILEGIRAHTSIELTKDNRFCCLWHNDGSPSAQVHVSKNDGFCYSCQKRFDIIDIVGKVNGYDFTKTILFLADSLGIDAEPVPKKKPIKKDFDRKSATNIRNHFYQDINGNEIIRKEIHKDANGLKMAIAYNITGIDRNVRNNDKVSGNSGLGGLKYPMYKLPDIVQAIANNNIIYLCEGEKDAESLQKLGFSSTCVGGTNSKWTDEHLASFPAGHNVVILVDNDDAGIKYGNTTASTFMEHGCKVKLIDLATYDARMGKKSDVTDWLELGHTADELIDIVGRVEYCKVEPKATATNGKFNTGSESEDIEWSEPINLHIKKCLPAFPIDVFPKTISDLIICGAKYLQVPETMIGGLIAGVISSTISKKMVVRIDNVYKEHLVLWLMLIAKSSTGKSPVMSLLTQQIHSYEFELNETEFIETAKSNAMHEIKKKKLESLQILVSKVKDTTKKSISDGVDYQREILDLVEDIEINKPKVITTLIVENITTEELITIVSEQKGTRISIITDEGDQIFINIMGAYSSKSNAGFYLKSYSVQTYKNNRRGRKENIPAPAINIVISLQPAVLEILASSKDYQLLRGQGVLGRFLCIKPDICLGERNFLVKPPQIPTGVLHAYNNMVKKLLKIDIPENPHELKLTQQAEKVYLNYRQRIEKEFKDDGLFADADDVGGKLHGQMLRLAGVLHVTEHVEGNKNIWEMPIESKTMENAIKLIDFYTAHTLEVFGDMNKPNDMHNEAVKMWDFILKTNNSVIERRDIQQRFKDTNGFKGKDLDIIIEFLIDYGYLIAQRNSTQKGGRKKTLYYINPTAKTPKTPKTK